MRAAGILLVALTACATTENFTPAERATAISPEGYTAADYELVAEGEHLGDAMVWSNGAHKEEGRTLVHVGFRVENVSDAPIEIDPDDVQIRVQADDESFTLARPSFVRGPTIFPRGTERTVSMYFNMPRKISPQDVDAFRVSWTAHSNGLEYTQRTPFLEYEEPVAVDPYYRGGFFNSSFYFSPFYDPFLYSPYYHRGMIVRPMPYRYHYHPSARRR